MSANELILLPLACTWSTSAAQRTCVARRTHPKFDELAEMGDIADRFDSVVRDVEDPKLGLGFVYQKATESSGKDRTLRSRPLSRVRPLWLR